MLKRMRGFTLVELLIVISIIIVLLVFVLINIRGQIDKANDAKRKSDLYTLKNSIEEYNNDKGSYPSQGAIDNCGSAFFTYLPHIPCDPTTRKPYGYFFSASTGGYRVCTVLADTTDTAIAAAGCGGASGCGLGGGYNYCLAQGATQSAVGTADEIIATGSTPTPTPTPGGPVPSTTLNPSFKWVCTTTGDCNSSSDPVGHQCPYSWEFACPPLVCQDPNYQCKR